MALSRIFSPVLHFDDAKGHPLAGGWLCTYLAGTNTPVKTYSDASGAFNETEIHLDSRGECEVWLDASVQYKFALYDSTKTVPIWTKDNITAPGVGIEPGTGKVVVAGTCPVTVTPHTVNGITTYMVDLEQGFIDEVHANTQAIADEVTRAQGAEQTLTERIETVNDTLSERITDETNRAQAAEASARTVVRAGEGIQVDKVVDPFGDGHDEYFVSSYLPEATSTCFGVVKTGSDTVQAIPKNEPSRNKHRTYPVQKNADGQMVVNVPWRNDFKNVHKGILILTIEGTCTDTYRPATAETSEHVTTMIVSPDYGETSYYGTNSFSVDYHEEEGYPADHRPVFSVDSIGKLIFTFENEQQDSLAFHCALSIASKSGYQFIEDNEPVFAEWGHDQSMKQPVMGMVRTLVIKKSDESNIHPILGNGISLYSPRTVDLETTYKIEAVAEYLYTCSPPEFFVFDAVDDEGDYMVDDEGDRMVIYEDNPDYVGA